MKDKGFNSTVKLEAWILKLKKLIPCTEDDYLRDRIRGKVIDLEQQLARFKQ